MSRPQPWARPGSPPRMRGKVSELVDGCCRRGITPAYAGKSGTPFSCHNENGDHPRVCGEKCELVFSLVTLLGSPPRMRGKARGAWDDKARKGITPAYAGKSYTRTCYAYNVRDHPRVCGEKILAKPMPLQGAGSPPRMRGKGRHENVSVRSTRITPAYAGKSGILQSQSTAR